MWINFSLPPHQVGLGIRGTPLYEMQHENIQMGTAQRRFEKKKKMGKSGGVKASD